VHVINLKNYFRFSVSNGIPVVTAFFLGGRFWDQNFVPMMHNIGDEEHSNVSNLNKFLTKIQRNIFLTPKSKFQNKIIIQQQDAKPEKVLQ
jgi:hypothetical protein